jgi:hypothetical protein
MYDAASRIDARVASVLKDKEWHWRPAKSEEMVSIQSKFGIIDLRVEDRAVWTASNSGKFSCATTWSELRVKGSEVNWWKILWFPHNIPQHSFIGWLAIKNKLSTRARMLKWGFTVDGNCGFCRNSLETRNHIFFDCSFS